jgi:ankyrin repeat protein
MNWRGFARFLCIFSFALSTAEISATILQSKVVDAETNEPIEGAVVAVVWHRPLFFPCMDSCTAFHDAAETITDVNGNFAIDISMGWLAHQRYITIYRPGFYGPGYFAASWLNLPKDPPLSESQVIRLIKAPSLQQDSQRSSYAPMICPENDINRFCVPPHKLKKYLQLKQLAREIRDSEFTRFEGPASLQPFIHQAVLRDDVSAVRGILASGGNPNEPDKEGRIPLMLLTNRILSQQIRRGVVLNRTGAPQGFQERELKAQDETSARQLEIYRLLLSAGANPNLKANNGYTALTFAIPTYRNLLNANNPASWIQLADVQSPKMVKELMTAGADPNIPNNDGVTPLMIAASRGLTEIVKALLAASANVNAKANFALTSYDVAMGEDVIGLIKTGRGSRKRLPPPPGVTALTTNNLLLEAAWNGNAEVVRTLLVDEKADPNFQSQLQETAIYYAIRSGDVATVETLLRHGANPNISVPHSGSPLTFATKALSPERAAPIIRVLTSTEAIKTPQK